MNTEYAAIEPARAEIDLLEGPAVVEFGKRQLRHTKRRVLQQRQSILGRHFLAFYLFKQF